MLQVGILLTLNTFPNVVLTILFHSQPIIPHLKHTLGDGGTIKVNPINTIMIGVYSNELISKLKAT